MELLVRLMRGFHIVAGITPPSKAKERQVAIIWVLILAGMAAGVYFVGRELVISMFSSSAAR